MYAPRALLLVVLAVFALGVLAWPVLRMLLTAGRTGVVVRRAPRAAHRATTLALAAYALGIVAWAASYMWVGPEAIGVWAAGPGLRVAALAMLTLAFALIAVAQGQMGRSWRVGIDPRKTELVTNGLFAVVRNPIYSGLGLAAASLALLTPSWWTLLGTVGACSVVAVQARLEEEHLEALHGRAYRDYAARVGRFVPGVGRLVSPR
jgi:protein-S-isoprenylcysteine O-methyltransferase Ste14